MGTAIIGYDIDKNPNKWGRKVVAFRKELKKAKIKFKEERATKEDLDQKREVTLNYRSLFFTFNFNYAIKFTW